MQKTSHPFCSNVTQHRC